MLPWAFQSQAHNAREALSKHACTYARACVYTCQSRITRGIVVPRSVSTWTTHACSHACCTSIHTLKHIRTISRPVSKHPSLYRHGGGSILMFFVLDIMIEQTSQRIIFDHWEAPAYNILATFSSYRSWIGIHIFLHRVNTLPGMKFLEQLSLPNQKHGLRPLIYEGEIIW